MARFQTLSTCVAAYHLDSGGVSGSTLVDKTSFGHDLPLDAGAIAYATRDGQECMDFTNDWWFEGDAPEVSEMSVVYIGAADVDGAQGSLFPVNFAKFKSVNDVYDGNPDSLTDADWFSSSYQDRAVFINSNRLYFFHKTGGYSAQAGTVTAGNLEILTYAAPFADIPNFHVQMNDDARVSGSFAANTHLAPYIGGRIRVGHNKLTAFTSGKYVSGKRLFIFEGDIFSHPDFATALAAEMAEWSIV